MKTKNMMGIMAAFLLAVGFMIALESFAFADGDDRGRHRNVQRLPQVQNELYIEECAACHVLFHPGLLPAGSWSRIINESEDHFGEDLVLDGNVQKELDKFLQANAADKLDVKLSRKIIKSLRGEEPLRITEISYVKRKHRGIRKSVFKRDSIRTFSNCGGCHTTAVEGDFEEDNVRIPRH